MVQRGLLLALGVIAVAHLGSTYDSRDQEKVRTLLNSVLTPEYNPLVRPYGVNGTVNGSDATTVGLHFGAFKILGVDETLGRFTFQTYFRQHWIDPRLAYNDTSIPYIRIVDCRSIWTPDFFEVNGISTDFGERPTRSLRIYPDGRVFYSIRLTQTSSCPLAYKQENQLTCSVSFGSYGYTAQDFITEFHDNDLAVVPDLFVPRYTFNGVTTRPCDYTVKSEEFGSQLYSCAGLDFKFTRTATV